MPPAKIKFKLSLKEVTFEFEGDRETAERISEGISRTLDGLGSAPDTLLGVERRAIEAPTIDVTPKQVRRRTRRRSTDNNAGDAPQSNSTTAAAVQHITSLRNEGFFDTPQVMGKIIAKLAALGHSYKNSDVSNPLRTLTQNKVLTREKNNQNQWQYTRGPA